MPLQPRKAPDRTKFRATGGDDDEKITPAKAAQLEDEFSQELDQSPSSKKVGVKPAPKKSAQASTAKKGQGKKAPARKVVDLDDRKLTKKDIAGLQEWKGKNRGRSVDAFFRGQAESARKKFGHKSVYVGSEADAMVIGIPMYGGHGPDAGKYPGCLPMEFVMAQDCFLLGLVMQLVGKHGVAKSGLLAEFGRWFYLAGGGLSLKEAEDKFNPTWYRSILGNEFYEMMPLHKCKSVEDWQRKLTFAIADAKSKMIGTKEKPGPGRTIPVLFGVDSIMGKQSEETQEGILGKLDKKTGKRGSTGKGHGSRGYPIEAQVITRYMRTIPGEVDDWPFAMVLINHLRVTKDDIGNTERSKAGGEQVNFQESFELELKKVGGHKKRIQCKSFEGIPVQISCEKNSFGPTHRSIQTRVLWWEEEGEDDEWVQRTVWDWDWSTVHLLDALMHGENSNPRIKEALKLMDFHLDCPTRSDIENTAWSKTLGMKSEDARSWSDVGAMIREDAALMSKLRKALRITRRSLMAGDYLDQLSGMSEDMP